MRVPRLRDLPLPVKLGALLSTLLLAISIFMLVYFPAQMSNVGQEWAERRAIGMSKFIASAIAPALEFDDAVGAQALIDHLAGTSDAIYGVLVCSPIFIIVYADSECARAIRHN